MECSLRSDFKADLDKGQIHMLQRRLLVLIDTLCWYRKIVFPAPHYIGNFNIFFFYISCCMDAYDK